MPNDIYQECIDACNRCTAACMYCASSCLQEENVEMLTKCIRLALDCSDICHLAVKYMARNSPFAEHICRVCAEICETCGEECRTHDMDHCQECADACFECAKLCREMAGA